MNTFKRSLAMMLVLCMLFSMAPITAFAEGTADPAGTAVPAADQPAAVQPAADQPAVDQPAVDQPAADQPAADQPAADQPAADQPVADQPAADQPAADQPAADQPAANQPAADQPAADQPAADQPAAGEAEKDPYGIALTAEDPYGVATAAVEPVTGNLSYASDYRILHLDCGRKYFTKDWIIALINEMEAAGYTHLELAVGNDNLRFLLDDMTVGSYTDAQVTAAIQAGNAAKHGAGELTQSEMDAIIAHAKSKNIGIIPLLNTPGHMYAIVTAMKQLGMSNPQFGSSASTVDVTNTEAVTFTQDLVKKYVDYFASKGCNEFNLGADEFANDDGNGQFSTLVNNGTYGNFIDYLNTLANYVVSKSMVPMAFNDGIYYNRTDDQGTIHPQIMVSYWSSGWWAYDLAPADYLASKGFKMINTHGDWYFILESGGIKNPGSNALNFNETSFPGGSTISDPQGSMFCIWCDIPGSATEAEVAAAARITLRKMAAAMKGTSSYSEEVIPGGFNADGTIAESCTQVTVKNEATKVEVTGCGLTRVNVTEAAATQIPTIADAAAVLAWDITPYAGEAKYEGGATVKLPVPADWNTSLVKGFYVENGQAVVVKKSTCADGFCSFEMPHFSVGGVMLLDETIPEYSEVINLEVGGTADRIVKGGDYTEDITIYDETVVKAEATYTYQQGTGGSVETVTSLEDGKEYYIINPDGKYLADDLSWVSSATNAVKWTASHYFSVYYYLSYNGDYLTGEDGNGNWTKGTSNNAAMFYLIDGVLLNSSSYNEYTVATGGAVEAINQTEITFEGLKPGTTYATVGDTTYKIVVTGQVEITIKYQTANGTVIKTETVNVADNATTYTVSNFTHTDGKYYVVDNTTLNITPATVTEYNVIVTETEEDLTQVASLSIEYWQTNARAEERRGSNVTTKTVTADAAYSENGIDLSTIIPVTTYKQDSSASDPALVYWRSRLLNRATNEQTGDNGDDETLNGIGFTKVRYWNGSWAVYTDAGEWQNITLAEYQLVAYYMNDMDLADEVSVATSDWGKKGNGEFAGSYLEANNVSLAFQVIYEGGTKFPANTGVELAPYTYFVNDWGNRGVGTVGINQIGDYQIWKITAETGEHNITYNGLYSAVTVNGFTWDNNEMIVWEDAKNPVSSYTILNPSGNPNTEGYYDNLRWNETNESILIRIYIKAVETEDSLKVVYYDEKFGAVLEEFNISVKSGHNFNDNIVNVSTGNTEDPPVFTYQDDNGSTVTVADRVNAGGYGIVNTVPKTQNFETNLANVAITNNRYSAELYKYTGSVISTDGKTITHYYNINQTALSPNFVVDFGLPLTFKLSDVVQEGIGTVMDVTVNPKTLYGTLSYTADARIADGTFTYTPTQILPTIDVLTISITFDDEEGPKTVTTNVGVTPATTVYYGEKFIDFGSGWTTEGTPVNVGDQQKAVLGGRANNEDDVTEYIYGYDTAYATSAGASDGTAKKATAIGSSATFTFTGTGIQVFANSAPNTGYVSVMVKNKETGAIANVSMVDTVVNGTASTETTGGQIGKNLSGLPVVSLVDLTGLERATYEVTISKIMDTDPIYIDGIRVFETVADQSLFVADEEDNPDFYEARDMVLTAMNITAGDSADYKTLYNQIYASTAGASAIITNVSAEYGAVNRQDLLDNGPKNELYLFKGDKLTMNVSTDRVIQLGLKAPEGSASFELNGVAKTLSTTVDMFYKVAEKGDVSTTHTITVENTGDNILSVTLLKICDDPNVSFPALTEANIRAILADAGITETPQQPTYTMVELKGTDVLIDGTVFDYTGEAIEPAITVNVNGVQLVEGKDYSVTYTNNVEPGTATVTIRGIATASETLGYTGEVSIDFTINAPAEPEVPEETTKPTKPGQGNKPGQDNKPGQGNKPGQDNKPGQGNKPGNNKPGQNNSVKKATLKITFVNLMGKKVSTATIAKTGAANEYGVFSAQEICEQAPARRHAVWFLPAIVPYGTAASIVVPVI